MHHNFLFDLDQTLLDFHASERTALRLVMQENGLSFSEEIYRYFKEYNKSLWLELEKGKIGRTDLFEKRFEALFRYCGEKKEGVDLLRVNREFIHLMSVNGVLINGALEFTEKVYNGIRNSRIYIITNGATVNAMGRIASTGLDRYLSGVFVSEDMGVAKPCPEYFDICLKRIGEPRESCIVIGDSVSSDMQGAKNASMNSVWFMPEGDVPEIVQAYEIDYCASSYDELYQVLRDWALRREKERTGQEK